MNAPKRRWHLVYEVSPTRDNPAFSRSRSKIVGCWSAAESLASAAEIAADDLRNSHWSIVRLVDAGQDRDLDTKQPIPTDTLEQEEVDCKVYCFDD
jgi:hypothetical protein